MQIINFSSRTFKSLLVLVFVSLFLGACSSHNKANSNLENKDKSENAAGGFTWGKNDKKTGLPQEELTSDEIIRRQEEVLKRQEIEKERLERERLDILRQQQYNHQLRELQQ